MNQRSAEELLAEIGVDMSQFGGAAQLASWAGIRPGQPRIRRKVEIGQDPQRLEVTLTESATAASRSRGSYLSAQYGRVRGRRGHAKAIGAVRHSILVAAYHMLDRGAPYQDLRADWFLRRHSPEHRARQLVHQLKALGYDVEVTYSGDQLKRPAAAAQQSDI